MSMSESRSDPSQESISSNPLSQFVASSRRVINAHLTPGESTQTANFPVYLLLAIALVCLLPTLANLIGVSFASPTFTGAEASALHQVAGGIHHSLLEWTAVSVALVTVIVAFSNFQVSREALVPVFGLALLASGMMDAFHTMAALRVIDSVAPNSEFIPFTWALSRTFNALILLIGGLGGLLLRKRSKEFGWRLILAVAIVLAFISTAAILISAGTANLPQTQFPGTVITRPFDVLPLAIYVLAIPVYLQLYRRMPNYLVGGILIGFLPEIVLESHMAFGSSGLFDNHFNIAHFLKIIAYLCPFIGLMLDYQRTHVAQNNAVKELENSEERFDIAMSAANSGVWDWDITHNKIFWSDRFRHLIGVSGLTVEPSFAQLTLRVHPSDRDRVSQALVDHLEHKTPYKLDYRVKSEDERFRWCHATGQAFYDHSGKAIRMAGSLTDINDAKAAENDLIVSNQRLSVAHEELERFTYVASHDLKAPLRGIDSLATWLEEDLGEKLDDDSREHLRLMRSRVGRLEGLLGDLLSYSRAGRGNAEIEAFDCNTLAVDVHDLIGKPEFELNIKDKLPAMFTAKSPFELVLRNLIQNAIKHHDREAGRIEISSWLEGDRYHFCVKDDGPGIPPEYHQRVFGLFQTLQSRDKVEGSGMGLALIRKVLISCNSDITIHSDPEKERGTTFEFTWPIDWQVEKAA
jgi:signal transduction histidine kinase